MDCKRVVALTICLLWSAAAAAQQSAGFKLQEQSFNAGGHPRDGSLLVSSGFRIRLDSIGEAVAQPLATSTSFHVAGGFVSAYPPPGEVLGLDFADETTLGWETEGSVGTYAIYRAATTTLPGLAYGACLDSTLTDESYRKTPRRGSAPNPAPALRDAGGPASLRLGRGLLPAGSRRSRWAAV